MNLLNVHRDPRWRGRLGNYFAVFTLVTRWFASWRWRRKGQLRWHIWAWYLLRLLRCISGGDGGEMEMEMGMWRE